MALTLSTIFFILINLVVIAFYLLVIVSPRAGFTRRVWESLWPIGLPVLVYVVFVSLILIFLRPNVLGLWQALYVENGMLSATTITFISKLYGAFPEYAVLHGWVHLVVGDIFMARWAYFDALERPTPNWLMSVTALLICLVGPLGVALYLGLRTRDARHSL